MTEFKVIKAFKVKVIVPKNNLCYAGASLLLFIILLGLFVPSIAKDPFRADITERLDPPSLKHPFGTDQLGRDLFSRVIYGARVSLLVATIISLFSMVIGCLIGAISGYFGGIIDELHRNSTLDNIFPGFIHSSIGFWI